MSQLIPLEPESPGNIGSDSQENLKMKKDS
jgi:hypothetical protein